MSYRCPIYGCKDRVRNTLLMCTGHWAAVPDEMKREVYAAYNAKKRHPDDEALKTTWLTVMRKAVKFVEEHEKDRMLAALKAVETWWLETGMHLEAFAVGAPGCIFEVRQVIAEVEGNTGTVLQVPQSEGDATNG